CKPDANARSVRRAVNRIGAEYFAQVLAIRRADTLAQSSYERAQKLAHIDAIEALYAEIMQKKECISLRTLAVTGNDLIALGVPTGKRIGAILNQLLDEVLQNPEHNTRAFLMEKAKTLL
ncbi:MAG: polynucleotide adenylyltransferase, partial [Lachnospiraceae bacterium]|nr:polynucleotide adenylyltransferase [Lachnospiraceae bacterium]